MKKKDIKEDVATNNVGDGQIASLGVGDHGEPPGKPKKRVKGDSRTKLVRRILAQYS